MFKFNNLRAEMARKGLTSKQVAAAIGISQKAFSNRMNGRTMFLMHEVVAIKNIFFPGFRLEYLFFEEFFEELQKGA